MKIIVLSALLSLLDVSYSQIYLQTFSAAGGSKQGAELYLQGTIGEAIVGTNTLRFTAGFNQPRPTCTLHAIDVVRSCEPYTWQDGTTYIASSDTATYTLTSVEGCDSIISLHLTVDFTPEQSTLTPSDQQLCSKEPIDFAQISDQLNYQWKRNGIPIQGANESTYLPLFPGEYSVSLTNSDCALESDTSIVTSRLNSFDIQESNRLLTPTKQGNQYQWYIMIEDIAYSIVEATSESYTPRYNGDYYVHVRDTDCSGSSSIYPIKEPTLESATRFAATIANGSIALPQQLQAFPNPARDLLYFTSDTEYIHLQLFDVLGNEILAKQHLASQPLDVSSLQGIYFLTLLDGAQRREQKITITK